MPSQTAEGIHVNPVHVNTSAPTYSDGDRAPLSADTTGALRVAIVSGGGSGGTASNFGAAFPATGTAAGFKDAGGNMAAGNLDGSGNLKVAVTGGAAGGTSATDGATFTPGTTNETPVGGLFDDTPPTAVTAGTTAAVRITSQRAMHHNLRKQDGTELGIATAPLRVDPTGTTTQPISAASLPLPSGAATAAKQPALGTAGTASADVITVQGVASMTALKVDGSAVTQPVSAASLPLPSGAATAAKQPALGTAGTASADVITIQGIASMTKLLVTPDALPANQSVNVSQINGVTPLMGNGTTGTGSPRVTIASDNTAFGVKNQAATSGGYTPYSFLAAAGANQDSTVVKASAGQIGFLYLTNSNAAARYVKIYDKATGPLSSDTPKLRILVPGNANGAGGSLNISAGAAFASGISFRITTGAADTDANAVAANEVIINMGYI